MEFLLSPDAKKEYILYLTEVAELGFGYIPQVQTVTKAIKTIVGVSDVVELTPYTIRYITAVHDFLKIYEQI
ncbi:hypothetical protein [Tepidibacter mesophilus]|uniref:hypothetical protein n=1 Tax=Tepidibacter mesophilus TaxID=655607 RepID=UPI000C077804|nr:hypothetical protein [Tepidibacter mesophilus]